MYIYIIYVCTQLVYSICSACLGWWFQFFGRDDTECGIADMSGTGSHGSLREKTISYLYHIYIISISYLYHIYTISLLFLLYHLNPPFLQWKTEKCHLNPRFDVEYGPSAPYPSELTQYGGDILRVLWSQVQDVSLRHDDCVLENFAKGYMGCTQD